MLKISKTYYPKSFQDIVNDILARLKANYNINIVPRSTFEALVNAFAYAIDNFLFYLNFVYNELFIDTAITEESILRLADFYGYDRKGAIPARLIANDNVPNTSISLDGFTFHKFAYLGDDKTFYEGNLVSTTINSEDGWAYKSFFIKTSLKPAHNMIFITDANQKVWLPFERFKIEFTDDGAYDIKRERVFWTKHTKDGFYITFGGSEYTILPDITEQTLTVTYIETNGNIGQVGTDIDGNIVIGNQSYRFIQGSDVETLENVRNIAIDAFWTKDDRILTSDDIVIATRKFNPSYRAMVTYFNAPNIPNKTMPFEFYINKIDEYIRWFLSFSTSDTELQNVINQINYYWNLFKRILSTLSFPALPVANLHVLRNAPPFQLTEDERRELSSYINERIPFGSWIYVLSDSSMAIVVSIEIQYKPKMDIDIESWKSEVVSLLLNYFDNLDYGSALRTSVIYSIIEATRGVDYFSVSYSFKRASDGSDASSLVIPRYENRQGIGIPIEFLPQEGYLFVTQTNEIKFIEIR